MNEVLAAAFAHHTPLPEPELAQQQPWIDACYAADSVEEIVERLRGQGSAAAKQTAETILSKSPTSLKVTLAAVRRARRLPDLAQVLEQEFLTSCSGLTGPDFIEGVRAQVIDKDRNPHWSPATLSEVTAADVARFFAVPGPEDEHAYPGPLFPDDAEVADAEDAASDL